VVNDVVFSILIVLQILWMLRSLLLDVEEEEIYMECPKGIDTKADEALLLLKSMMG
jgi:hypothetical protein